MELPFFLLKKIQLVWILINCFGISELQIHGQPSSTRTMLIPEAAICRANSLPIPDEAPVTSAQGPNLFYRVLLSSFFVFLALAFAFTTGMMVTTVITDTDRAVERTADSIGSVNRAGFNGSGMSGGASFASASAFL
jgi:hypothetical protein